MLALTRDAEINVSKWHVISRGTDFSQRPHGFAGEVIEQLPDRFPILKYVYTDFEYTYSTDPGVQFSKKYWPIPVVLVCVYMVRLTPTFT